MFAHADVLVDGTSVVRRSASAVEPLAQRTLIVRKERFVMAYLVVLLPAKTI